jgi:hypothetical protein
MMNIDEAQFVLPPLTTDQLQTILAALSLYAQNLADPTEAAKATALAACAALCASPRSTPAQIFVTNFVSGTIGEYDATTGATVNAALVTGLNVPQGIAIAAVPEPTTILMAAIGLVGVSFFELRSRVVRRDDRPAAAGRSGLPS